jgi:ABC-type branched-subunit amino acid transport system ATPase component
MNGYSYALRTSALSVRLGPSAVWSFDGFEVSRLQTLGLTGGNGSGKTTLVRAIAGAVATDAGQILLEGVDITRWSPEARAAAGLAFMPQKNNVFPNLSVKDNLLIATDAALGRSRQGDCLDELSPRLAKRPNVPASSLSGGERQILALAMTFQRSSHLYLLDEPFAGLSGELAARARELVSLWVQEDQASAIVVEHEKETLAEFCDKIIDIDNLRT